MRTALSVFVIAFLLVTGITCSKESAMKSAPAVGEASDAVAAFSIGQHYGGGIIFYIDDTGEHGLIADDADFPTLLVWWNGFNIVTGANSKRIYGGAKNTKKIIQKEGKPGNYAALMCSKLKKNGYTDWYLPSENELNELYKQKDVVGGFKTGFYWTSTDYGAGFAKDQHFLNGDKSYAAKSGGDNVRAIRAF